MWEKENKSYEENLLNEYKQIINKAKRKSDSLNYFYIQICFSRIIVIFSVMLKNGNRSTFAYVKESYDSFFETENYMESTFSFNSFVKKMEDELKERFIQLETVFNSKGSADIFPSNTSLDKINLKNKGVSIAQGYISSPYGVRKNPFNNKEKEFHTGLDIAAPKGTFIRAAFSGIVTYSACSDIAGNYIKIDSPGGITTMYAHNQFNLIKTGDKVIAGQVIANMGQSGLATGPHVHFEFLLDNIRYNPIYAIEI